MTSRSKRNSETARRIALNDLAKQTAAIEKALGGAAYWEEPRAPGSPISLAGILHPIAFLVLPIFLGASTRPSAVGETNGCRHVGEMKHGMSIPLH